MNPRPSSRWVVVATLVAWMLGVGSSAAADEPRTHDGFFLRLQAGVGVAGTAIEPVPLFVGIPSSVADTKWELSGGVGSFDLALGGIVAPNLALHGSLIAWSSSDPDIEVSGIGGAEINGDLSLAGITGGLTYYFMPANVFLSGSLGLAALSLDLSGGPDGSTDAGIVGEFMVGKEWWTGTRWGLGLAGAVRLHSIPDGDIDERWNGVDVTLRFSATMN